MLAATILCLVVGIVDGDTLTVRCGGAGSYEQVKVRLSAIDAPEKRQPFGELSCQTLPSLCFNLQATITPKAQDRYRRSVADVQCRGRDAGAEQVRAGMAWVYARYAKGYGGLYPLQDAALEGRQDIGPTHHRSRLGSGGTMLAPLPCTSRAESSRYLCAQRRNSYSASIGYFPNCLMPN